MIPKGPLLGATGNRESHIMARKGTEERRSEADEQSEESPAFQPVIKFNGIKQVGFQLEAVAECAESASRLSDDLNLTDRSESDDEEHIDNIIVCKIENEFGYPEEYLLNCLKTGVKNDATTCYYLFCKEDKHELVNLLADSGEKTASLSKPHPAASQSKN